MLSRLGLFPPGSQVNDRGHLVIGGCDVVELAAEFGTPLYLYDEASLRARCREFRHEFSTRYPGGVTVAYACKAFINRPLARLFQEEGMGLDIVSGGEMGIARAAGYDPAGVYFAGNNKSDEELREALEWGLGRLVVDNPGELRRLGTLAVAAGRTQDILLRLTPGVEPHTHRYITTGNVDSKFGIPLSQGADAIAAALETPGIRLVGLHFHIGSLIYEVEPYQDSIRYVLELAAGARERHGFSLQELDVGGGFAVQYTLDRPAPPVAFYAEKITAAVRQECQRLGLELPRLVIEPGRAVVARAGVALYTVGTIKDIPGVRRYVAVDGGMADNIRPALYQARHEAVLAGRMTAGGAEVVTIAGKFCESGDILIRDISLPPLQTGDILAVAGCGAYCIPESMNYNAFFRPPVVLVKDGKARLIRRRETLDDLMRCDVLDW